MKKTIKYLCILVGAILLIFLMDLSRSVLFNKEPLIVISTTNDNGVKVSNSILYKTYNCNGKIYVESISSKFNCPIEDKLITLTQNNKDICIDGIDYFYEDENYRYYFTCLKSNYIIVNINDKEYMLKDALENGIITIKDIENKIEFKKESKKENKVTNDIKLIKENNKCSTKVEKIYTYNKVEYYYDCSDHIYTLKIGNENISLSKALESGKVTINTLKELGLNVISKEIKDNKKEEVEIKKENEVTTEKENDTKIDIKKDDNIDNYISNKPELVYIKSNNTSQKIVTIYKDSTYEYYYYTPSNGDYNIKYQNKYYTISDAINKNIITLSSLQGLGIDYYKKKLIIKNDGNLNSNNNSIKLIDKSNGGNCASAIEYFYEDNAYKYYFTCIKSSSMYLLINGKEYPLKEALNNKITTIEELEANGIKFLKQSKNLVTK